MPSPALQLIPVFVWRGNCGATRTDFLASVTTNPDFRLAGQLAPIFCELNLARTGNPIRKKNHSARKNLEFDMFGTNAMVGLLKLLYIET